MGKHTLTIPQYRELHWKGFMRLIASHKCKVRPPYTDSEIMEMYSYDGNLVSEGHTPLTRHQLNVILGSDEYKLAFDEMLAALAQDTVIRYAGRMAKLAEESLPLAFEELLNDEARRKKIRPAELVKIADHIMSIMQLVKPTEDNKGAQRLKEFLNSDAIVDASPTILQDMDDALDEYASTMPHLAVRGIVLDGSVAVYDDKSDVQMPNE